MRKNRFIFTIEGPDENNQHLELAVFTRKIGQFLNFLKGSARESGNDGIKFHVVGLSHSSPSTIECETVGKGRADTAMAFNSIRENLDSVEKGQTQNFSNDILSAMESLADIKPEKIARAEIRAIYGEELEERQSVYKLDENFRKQLNEARKFEEKVVTSVDGKLEKINIHNNVNTFTIYTFFSPVACKFPRDLLGEVQGALGFFVSVWGECSYRPDAAFPYKIEVKELRVLPPSNETPSMDDLYGIAPDLTGDKESEQFMRELRDEWGKKDQ